MEDEKHTPDQSAAESTGRSIDGRIYRLNEERAQLAKAAERIAEIDAELAVLQSEKEKIDPRRPPKPREPAFDVKIVPPAETKETP